MYAVLGEGIGIQRWKTHLFYTSLIHINNWCRKKWLQRRCSNVIWSVGCGICAVENSSLCDAVCGAGRGKGFHGRVAFGSEGWVMFEQSGDSVSYWGARGSGERRSSLALAKRYSELAFNYISYIYIFFFIFSLYQNTLSLNIGQSLTNFLKYLLLLDL